MGMVVTAQYPYRNLLVEGFDLDDDEVEKISELLGSTSDTLEDIRALSSHVSIIRLIRYPICQHQVSDIDIGMMIYGTKISNIELMT